MTNYTEREVNTAIRRLRSSIDEVASSTYATYKANIKSFVELTHTDPIIHSIVEPFRNIDVNMDKIHSSGNGFYYSHLNFPTKVEGRIAYVLRIFDAVAKENFSFENYTYRIYRQKRYEDNINSYMYDIARPQLKELVHILIDLQKYDVEGKEVIPEHALQIVNHGTIMASQGSSIAIGKDIQTTINYSQVSNKIMEEVRKQGIIPEEKLAEVELIAEEVQAELLLPNPSQGKLKQLSQKVYSIGEQALLKVFTTVVTDPRWGQVAAETIMGIN